MINIIIIVLHDIVIIPSIPDLDSGPLSTEEIKTDARECIKKQDGMQW